MSLSCPTIGPVTDRRRFLRWGAYSALSALAARSLRGNSDATVAGPIRSCILLMYYGGPSHLDTWDMKPRAPAEVRGEYQPISTSVPGRFVCEHLARTSRVVDKLAVIRSLHHPMSNHNSAMYEALVGRIPAGGDNEILGTARTSDFPCYGAMIDYLAQQGRMRGRPGELAHVALPHVMHNVVDLPGQNAGFLGGGFDPLQITSDPNDPAFQVDDLTLPDDVSLYRLASRRKLLGQFNRSGSPTTDGGIQSYRQRAFDLLGSDVVHRAFNIASEPSPLRDRYGRHKLGQSLLLARRLVELGVRFVNVNDQVYNGQDANWDSHASLFPRHKELLAPADQAYSALIEDLDRRGLLDSTLVVAMGEFGRTPKINGNAGRDHWPHCYSVVLAGGGVAAGTTFGASDRIGAEPAEHPVTPGDLAATIFWRFGLDYAQEVHDPLGRKFQLATGKPIASLFPNAAS